MLTPELEQLIQYALEDGVLTDKERSVLMRKAQEAGADLDEFEMILEAKLHEVQKAAAAAAPKPKTKYGDVRKCPSCGAVVSAFTTKCQECGFEFGNVEAVQSANSLFEKLQALEMEKAKELAAHNTAKNQQLQSLSERHNQGRGGVVGLVSSMSSKMSERQQQERDDLIRSLENDARHIERKYLDAKINLIKVFAVPNTKADLLELLSLAQSSAYDNDGVVGPEEEAWLQKTDQVYQKLVICSADDKATLNQATSMIVSLIKRLPKPYKNFTRIPAELRETINAELKAEKADKKKEKLDAMKTILMGWRGIALGVALLVAIIGLIAGVDELTSVGVILFGVMVWLTIKAVKSAGNDEYLV